MVYFLCKAYDSDRQNCYFALSLPVRGAWIEILTARIAYTIIRSLPVRGAWIEIRRQTTLTDWKSRRSPCGERGLKYALGVLLAHETQVAPRAGSVD